ncbi:unnamed protein product [Caenorhabditis auriculariae]|uniref:polynucleotide adenylyltransferase n=1 Tax=Caenorhabditis auriculariae TaxID=2777116 RepID=A0A8S1GR99_9PELO|nr:unnamed protein product [Caenorhabditis auriculariae]
MSPSSSTSSSAMTSIRTTSRTSSSSSTSVTGGYETMSEISADRLKPSPMFVLPTVDTVPPSVGLFGQQPFGRLLKCSPMVGAFTMFANESEAVKQKSDEIRQFEEEKKEEEEEEVEETEESEDCQSSCSSSKQTEWFNEHDDSYWRSCGGIRQFLPPLAWSSSSTSPDDDSEDSDEDEQHEGCVIVPLSDADMAYVEWAHSESRLLEIYAQPMHRFHVMPPMSFCLQQVLTETGTGPYSYLGGFANLDSLKSSLPTVSTATNGDASNTVKQTLELINKDVIKDSTMLSGPPPPTSASILASGQFQVSKMDVLSENIWHYHNKVAQTDAMLHRKLHLRDMLYYAIAPVFPMCGLYVVGSSLNGFGNNSSDMDLCLMITNKELDQRTDAVVVLNMVLSTLQHEKIVVSQQLILAKVPIVRIRFTEPFLDIQVDLNANNSVAIKNTHLLCYYSSFDWRVRPIVSVVKEWAKRKGINDANRSTFTSYSLVLMVIHYLQYGADPPVLPNLQKMYPNRFSNKCDVRTLNVTLPLSPPPESTEWKFNDSATLGELLIGFLDYYASKFNYDRDAISIRQGRRIERAAVARQRTGMSSSSMSSSSLSHGGSNIPATAWRAQWRCVCIEEPFTNSNTAHSIYDEMVFGAIKDAFREAHSELERNRDLSRLLDCKPINVAAPVGGAIVYTTNYEERSVITATSAPAPPPSIASSIRNMLPMGMFQQHKHKQQVQRNLPHPSQQQHLPQAVAQAFHASNVAPPPPPPPTTANTVTTSAVTTASLTSSAATTPSVSPTRLLDDVVPSAATSVAVQMTPEKPQPAKPQQNGKTSQKKAAPQKSNTAVNKSNSSANHHGGQQQHNPNQNSSRKSAAGGKDGSNKERK